MDSVIEHGDPMTTDLPPHLQVLIRTITLIYIWQSQIAFSRTDPKMEGLDCHVHIHPQGDELVFDGKRVILALEGAGLQRACLISQAYQTEANPACKNKPKPCPIDRGWVQKTNDWTVEQAALSPRLISFCSVDINATFASEEIQRCSLKGHRGLKLHTVANGIKLSDKKSWLKVQNLAHVAGSLNLPVLFHSSFQEKTEAVALLKMAEETPKTIFIFGHMLGKHFALLESSPLPNAYIETSVFPIYLEKQADNIVKAFRGFGIDRVLFGSDWPVFHPSEVLAFLRRYPFTDEELNKILVNNGEKLFPISSNLINTNVGGLKK